MDIPKNAFSITFFTGGGVLFFFSKSVSGVLGAFPSKMTYSRNAIFFL